MTDANESAQGGRKNLLTGGLLLIILLMIAFAVFGDRGVLRILQAHEQKQELEQKLEALQLRQQELKAEIERLQSDKSYWEYLARTKLGMVREGELIYHLPDLEHNSKEAMNK